MAKTTLDIDVDIKEALRDIRKFSKQSSEALAGIESATNDTGAAAIKLNQAFELAAKGMRVLGAAFKLSIGSAIDLEASIAEITTLLDEGAPSAAALTEEVLGLQESFGGNQTEIAKAFYQAISSGAVNASNATDLLVTANKLAIGGVTTLDVAVDGLTNIISAYGLNASEAANVSDALFLGMKSGKTTVGELSGALGQVATIADKTGVSFQELIAAVSAITTSGVKTSVAVTQVRAALVGLQKTTPALQKVLDKLKISSVSAAIAQEGFGEVLNKIVGQTDGSNEALFELFGSVEAVGAISALMSDSIGNTFIKTVKEMGEAAKNAGAVTEASFNKISDTTKQRLVVSLGKLEANFTRIGGVLNTVLLPFMDEAERATSDLALTVEGLNEVLLLTAKALSLIIQTGSLIITTISDISSTITSELVVFDVFETINTTMSKGNILLSTFAGSIGIVTDALGVTEGVADRFSNAISESQKSIVETEGSFDRLAKNIDAFSAGVEDSADRISIALAATVLAAQENATESRIAAAVVVQAEKDKAVAAQSSAGQINAAINEKLAARQVDIQTAKDVVAAEKTLTLAAAAEQTKRTAAYKAGAKERVQLAKDEAQKIAEAFENLEIDIKIGADFDKLAADQKAFFEKQEKDQQDAAFGVAGSAVSALGQGAAGAAGAVSSLGAAGADLLLPGAGQVVGPLLDLLAQGPDAVKEQVTGFVEAIPGIITSIAESLPVLVESLIIALAENADVIIIALVKAIPTVAIGLAKAIPAVAFALRDAVVGGFSDIGSSPEFGKISSGIGNALTGPVQDFINKFVELHKRIFELHITIGKALISAIAPFAQKFIDINKKIFNAHVNVIKKIVAGASAFVQKLLDSKFIKSLITLGKILISAHIKIFNIIKNVIKTFIDKFIELNLKLFEVYQRIFNVISDVVVKIFNTFVGLAKKLFAIHQKIFNTIRGAATEFITKIAEAGGSFITKISEAGGAFVTKITSAASDFITSISDQVASAFDVDFTSGLTDFFNKLVTTLEDAITAPIDALISFLSGSDENAATSAAGEKLEGFVEDPVGTTTREFEKAFGSLAQGGQIPSGFPNDTFPARLTSGELVIPPGDTSRLSDFLDRQQIGGGGDSPAMVALLSQVVQLLSEGQTIDTTIEIDGQAIGDVILQLNRDNQRLTA